MSDLDRLIRARRMVRSFAPDPIPAARVDELLDLARRGPSAGNTQAAAFVVLDRPELVARYWDVTLPPPRRAGFRWHGLLDAPVLIIVTTRPDRYVERYAEADKARPGLGDHPGGWTVPYWWVDAGAVIQNLLLLCVERSLGACLFGLFDHEEAVRDSFGIDPAERLVATIAIGRARPDAPGRSAGRPRPPLATVVRRPGQLDPSLPR